LSRASIAQGVLAKRDQATESIHRWTMGDQAPRCVQVGGPPPLAAAPLDLVCQADDAWTIYRRRFDGAAGGQMQSGTLSGRGRSGTGAQRRGRAATEASQEDQGLGRPGRPPATPSRPLAEAPGIGG
jgi:hypothetical protein